MQRGKMLSFRYGKMIAPVYFGSHVNNNKSSIAASCLKVPERAGGKVIKTLAGNGKRRWSFVKNARFDRS
jgi:hypothetical protein